MDGIRYHCPRCEKHFIVPEGGKEETISGIPTPGVNLSNMQFQDHGDHTVFLNFSNSEVSEIRVIPQIRTVFDTLLNDNIRASRIVNNLIEKNGKEENCLLLYLSPPQSFEKFFLELSKNYIETEDDVELLKTKNMIIIAHTSLKFVITDYKIGETILRKGTGSIDLLKPYNPLKLKSLVLDTTSLEEKDIINKTKKSKIDPLTRVIIAFNKRLQGTPPLDLRELFIDKFNIENLELLNYQDTNGLKTILLQSYYNVSDIPFEAREVFELTEY